MIANKKKVAVVFDYEALDALTGPALIEKIKSECDSESIGYLNTIERFEISYPHTGSSFHYYQVYILSRSRHVKSKNRGILTCHYFVVDIAKPANISHQVVSHFLVDRFYKLCKGFKEND